MAHGRSMLSQQSCSLLLLGHSRPIPRRQSRMYVSQSSSEPLGNDCLLCTSAGSVSTSACRVCKLCARSLASHAPLSLILPAIIVKGDQFVKFSLCRFVACDIFPGSRLRDACSAVIHLSSMDASISLLFCVHIDCSSSRGFLADCARVQRGSRLTY